MAIYGLTHTEKGKLIQQFAVDVKVSIGLPMGSGRTHPQKLDHFYFTTKSKSGEWVENTELTKELQQKYCPELVDTQNQRYRPPVREFDVLFLSDDIEEIFRTEYAWWSKSECKCRGNGDGTTASRVIGLIPPDQAAQYPKGTRYVPWVPCGKGCPDLEKGACGASGVLHFTLFDRPTFGSIAVYYTTSIRTIRQIYTSLEQIRTFTGGFLKGIRFTLKLKPGRTRYLDDEGKPKAGNAFFVHIEFRYKDYETMITRLLEQSTSTVKKQAIQQREVKTLTAGLGPIQEQRIIPLGESSDARIFTTEFTPPAEGAVEPDFTPETEDDIPPPETEYSNEDAAALDAVDTMEQQFDEICERLKLSKAKKDILLATLGGNIEDALSFMSKFHGYIVKLGYDIVTAEAILKRGLGNVKAMWQNLEADLKAKEEAAAEAQAQAKVEAGKAKRGKVIPAAKEDPKKQEKTENKANGGTKAEDKKADKSEDSAEGKDDWGEW